MFSQCMLMQQVHSAILLDLHSAREVLHGPSVLASLNVITIIWPHQGALSTSMDNQLERLDHSIIKVVPDTIWRTKIKTSVSGKPFYRYTHIYILLNFKFEAVRFDLILIWNIYYYRREKGNSKICYSTQQFTDFQVSCK